MSGDAAGPRAKDTLRVLLATDNHLGYAEKDPVRGPDSFRAFQEILQLAKTEQVDLLLLGGDLFHDNKPSRATMYQTMRLLRNYCMGDGAVRFQIVSDQSLNFPNFGAVNYEDPHFNIQLPVFSIHGNHDDPAREAGQQSLAALDLLSAANLVNYFGKSDHADEIQVFPILLVKGATKVAIYGLGSMRDERLNRMFAQQNVVFRRPAEHPEQWFSIFVVHQNRDNRGRGAKNCLPESFIPEFIDFVVWGHEHECDIHVAESLAGDFFITQPGSSVATSLVEGEAKTKQVAILEVFQQSFRMSSRVLTSVRPFKLGEIVLAEVDALDPNDPNVTDRIRDVLEDRVRELLAHAEEEHPNRPPELKQVLIRVRVEHSGFPVLVNQRFGSKFVGTVANPNDILLFYRRKKERAQGNKTVDTTSGGLSTKGSGGSSLQDPIRPTRLDTVTIEDLLCTQLHKPDQSLVFLPEAPFALALEEYIVKNIPTALEEFVDGVLAETQKELTKTDTRSRQDIMAAVEKKKDHVNAEHALNEEEKQQNSGSKNNRSGGFQDSLRSQSQSKASMKSYDDDGGGDDDEYMEDRGTPPPKGRAAAKSPGRYGTSRTTTTKCATTKRKTTRGSEDDDAFDDDGGDMAYSQQSSRSAARSRKPKSQVSTPPSRKAPARAARAKSVAKRGDLFSDEEPIAEDDDGDEDYEMAEEDESEMVSQSPAPRRAAKQPRAPATNRKRLRKASESNDDEGDEDFGGVSSRRVASRPAPASKASESIDLVSSEEEEATPAAPPAAPPARKPPLSRARKTPQPTINELFKKQAVKKHDDELENDSDFSDLTAAKPTTTGARAAAAAAEEQSQSQSQGSQGSVKKRKLPLSMLAASQSTPAKAMKGDAGDGGTPAARKGWGRTRR